MPHFFLNESIVLYKNFKNRSLSHLTTISVIFPCKTLFPHCTHFPPSYSPPISATDNVNAIIERMFFAVNPAQKNYHYLPVTFERAMNRQTSPPLQNLKCPYRTILFYKFCQHYSNHFVRKFRQKSYDLSLLVNKNVWVLNRYKTLLMQVCAKHV